MEAFSSERREIMTSVEKRGHITAEEAAELNKKTSQKLQKTLNEFHAKAMETMKMQKSDN